MMREEREAFVKELAELERFRNLTEDEKREEMKINPKQITNKATKGKYKFMQNAKTNFQTILISIHTSL